MPYDESLIRSIADRHGLPGALTLLPKGGMVNEAREIDGTHVLRIVEWATKQSVQERSTTRHT